MSARKGPRSLPLYKSFVGFFICLSIYAAFFAANSACAQDLMRIVAIVNDDIISFYDVTERMKLVNLSNNVAKDQQSQKRLAAQVLRLLIDEHMKLQEAENQNVTVSNRDIKKQIEQIAQSNNLTADEFKQFLKARNINISTLTAQIKSQIAWRRTLAKTVRRKIYIDEDEIDEEIARLETIGGNIQKRVFHIFIANGDGQSDIETRRLVDDLMRRLAAGENFASLARNYSQSANASVGGDMGWISAGELSGKLNSAVKDLKPGAPPLLVESVSGYHILKVTGERSAGGDINDTKFDLVQVILSLDANMSENDRGTMASYIAQLTDESPDCGLTEEQAQQIEGAKRAAPKGIRLGDMAPAVRQVVESLQPGQMTPAIIVENTLIHMTVCKRYEPTSNLPSRREISNRIGQQRLDLLARKYLRDLRNSAYIDVRL